MLAWLESTVSVICPYLDLLHVTVLCHAVRGGRSQQAGSQPFARQEGQEGDAPPKNP